MAHTAGTSFHPQRLSALGAIALVAVAAGFAFGRILDGHGATYRMITVGLASGVLAWATERRGMLLATLASAAALLLTVTWLSAPHSTWFALPTVTTARSLAALATLVGAQAREYVSPAPATPSLLMAGVIAVWAAVFSCYALAFRAQSPLLALVPPLALVVFADSVLDDSIKPVYGVLFLIAALAVLFADSLRRIRAWGPVWSPVAGSDRLLPVAGSNARRVGAGALVVAALAPLLVPGFGTTSVLDLSRIGGDHRLRVSPLVQMGSILSDAKNDPDFFQVQVPPGQHSNWRMESLDSFDGNTWEARPDNGVVAPVQNGAIQSASEPGESVTQTFTMMDDLGYSWLVSGGNVPTQIAIGHDVVWHPLSSSLTMDGWPDEGESYTVTSTYANPTPHQLRIAGVGPVDAADLELPTDPTMAIPASVTRAALRWTAGADSQYDEVMAIMEHLQPSHGFEYNPTVDLQDSSQALEDFLFERKGFCQQFAGLMAVMLRSLHIPARIGLGFTEGTPVTNEPGTYIVSGRDYHSWVEVPFNGFGYLTFDPTPSFEDLSSTSYATVTTESTTCIRHCDTGPQGGTNGGPGHQQQIGGEGNLGTQFGPGEPGTTPRALGISRLALAAVAVALLVGIGMPVVRRLRRRRRLRAANDPRMLIITTYDVFADRARELGVGRAPGDTLDEFRDRLVATDRLQDADRPLVRMTTEVVRAAYAADPPDPATAQEVSRDADAVLQALRSTTSLRQRVLGRYRLERGTSRRTRRIGGP
jgi:transglutaminase TgpA-like protein/transglutaminase superfamily protein